MSSQAIKTKVNPQKAEAWLATNIANNRRISRGRVKLYASDMIAGRWHGDNGETIKFDVNGRLIDGQHRLLAVVESGRSVDMLVFEGVDPDSVHTIDQGRARSANDMLVMNGEANSRVLSASAKITLNYLDGLGPNRAQSTPAVIAFTNEFAGLRAYAGECQKLFGQMPPSPVAAVCFLASADGTRVDQIKSFIEGLASGANLPEGDPRLAFRQAIQSMKSRTHHTKSLDQTFVFQLAARSWNNYVDGRTLTQTRFSRSHKDKKVIIPNITGAPRYGAGVATLRAMLAEGRKQAANIN